MFIFFYSQAANQITTIEGLDGLEKLQKLHIRDNQISNLDGFSENLKSLQYINMRYMWTSDMVIRSFNVYIGMRIGLSN